MNKLVLFDIDKTLVHGSKAHASAFTDAFKKVYGVDTHIGIINHHGMTDQQIIVKVLQVNGIPENLIRSKIKECMKVMVDTYKKTANGDEIVILQDVRNVLEEFNKRKVLMGLVTGNLEAIARGKLSKVNLNQYFKLGGFGSDSHEVRADLVKLAIKKAEKEFGFKSDGKNVFLFGDAPADMQAGKEGKAITIGITTGIFSREELLKAGADYTIENLADTNRIFQLIMKEEPLNP